MTTQPSAASQSGGGRRAVFLGMAVVLIAVAGYFGWRHFRGENKQEPPPVDPAVVVPPPADSTAAMLANLRGVGQMEQFDYVPAVQSFEQAVKADPTWLPARINLGIALLNTTTPENLARAIGVFEQVLTDNPNQLNARYCLGMIALYQNRLADAYRQFDAVGQIDPSDAHTWLHKGITHPNGKESPEARKCFVEALRLNPYLNAARYMVAQHPVGRDLEVTKQLLEEHRLLVAADWEDKYKIAYSEMGPYAEVIGRFDKGQPSAIGPLPMLERWKGFEVRLAPRTTWAKDGDLSAGASGQLERAMRGRFGAAIIAFDYNRDGRPDLFIPSAVMRDKSLGDLLLRNDGNGVFTDVTAIAGLTARASWGCFAADYDNDGFPDLLLTGSAGPRLFRNRTDDQFEDVSAKAGFTELKGAFLTGTWLDIDQDGDLDLVLSQYGDSPGAALALLQQRSKPQGATVLLLNTGVAPPAAPGAKQPGLSTSFTAFKNPEALQTTGAFVGAAVSDLDGDRDVDLLLLADGQPPLGVWNDRLIRFSAAGTLSEAGLWNGALVLDVNHDQRSDLLLLHADKPPALWMAKNAVLPKRIADAFAPGVVNGPTLIQAQAVDIDFDSWTDVVGLSAERKPVLLHNDGTGKLVQRAAAFGDTGEAFGAAIADLDGDGPGDLVLFTDAGLQVQRNLGNGNHYVRLDISGRRDKGSSLRTNSDGVGSWIVAQSGTIWSGLEKTSREAGLRQSSLPIDLGLGKATQAEVIRIRWPDGVPQAELNIAAGQTTRITELNRKGTSCPVLFVWDGQRYRYVTDFLGAGTVGEVGADGSTRPPRPEESLAIDGRMLALKDGKYWIKIAEPMDEVLYLDRLQWIAVDHPIGEHILPDERFVISAPPPTQELLRLRDLRPVQRAVDHRGNDVTALLRDIDRSYPSAFHLRSWLGFAEEHFVELDFGDSAAKQPERSILCLHGWTDYAYPESIFAASQAGIEMLAPQLEYRMADGTWKTWGELGFPAGLPRTMTRDVSELIKLGNGRFRIRTNMQIYWDQIVLARQLPPGELQTTALPLASAVLRHRGFAQEILPDGKLPIVYDDERLEPVAIAKWSGRLTRLGDVAELLQDHDDRFVLCGPGDEIEIAFDAGRLPPLREGYTRSFVLRTWGYCKDSSLFTVTGAAVEPLPFRDMGNYPPRKAPASRIVEYDRQWNQRQIGR